MRNISRKSTMKVMKVSITKKKSTLLKKFMTVMPFTMRLTTSSNTSLNKTQALSNLHPRLKVINLIP